MLIFIGRLFPTFFANIFLQEEIVEENPLSPTTEKMKPVTIKEEKVEDDDEGRIKI
jgi:hypothetical protein